MGQKEIVKVGLLQLKTYKTSGRIFKKTRAHYSSSDWVVLCIHDNKIPNLEWYHTQDRIPAHQPFKVIDLLYADHVVENDARTFVVSIRSFGELELVTIEVRECTEWVASINATLERLGIIQESTNIYIPSSHNKKVTKESVSPRTRDLNAELHINTLENEMTARISPSRFENRIPTHRTNSPRARPESKRAPPLPPRRDLSEPMLYRKPLDTSAIRSRDELYDVIRTDGLTVFELHRSENDIDDDSRADSSTTPSYGALSPAFSSSNLSLSPLQHAISSTSLCSSFSSDLRLSTSSNNGSDTPSDLGTDYDTIQACCTSTKYVSLSLSMIVENVLFVEVLNRIWVAGWTEMSDRQLGSLLSIGDELVEVEGKLVHGLSCSIPQLFYDLSTPGANVTLRLRITPFGQNYQLIKPISKNREMGIVFHKNKNRIEEVLPDSIADHRGLAASMPAALRSHGYTAAFLTEMDGKRLNLFAHDEQFKRRLELIGTGTEFNVIVHPYDFIKRLKEQMIAQRNSKQFVCRK